MKIDKKIGFLIVFLFVVPTIVSAVGYSGIGGRPAFPDPDDPKTSSWFIFNVEPGNQIQDYVEVVNNTEEDLTMLVYPQDSIKSSDGGFALKQYGASKNNVGAWVKLYPDFPTSLSTTSEDIIAICDFEKNQKEQLQREDVLDWCAGEELIEVELSSNSSTVVPFVMSVPEGVDVGEHTGGILIQKKDIVNDETGGIIITTRVGVRIYETVPGDVERVLKLTKFDVSQDPEKDLIVVSLGLKNLGNASIDAKVTMALSDKIFRGNTENQERTVQILRDDEFITNYEIGRPRIGIVSVKPEITFEDSDGEIQSLSTEAITLWIIPWMEVGFGAAGLVLILVALIIFIKVKKRKYSTEAWVRYKVKKGDTITHLATEFGLSWKFLAKANKIGPPFVLEVGQVIKLPDFPAEPVLVKTIEDVDTKEKVELKKPRKKRKKVTKKKVAKPEVEVQ